MATFPRSSMMTVQFSNFWFVTPSMFTPFSVTEGAAAAGRAEQRGHERECKSAHPFDFLAPQRRARQEAGRRDAREAPEGTRDAARLFQAASLRTAAYTPRASGPQTTLWIWSERRASSPLASSQRARSFGSTFPHAGEKRTSSRSSSRSRRAISSDQRKSSSEQ